MKKKILVFLAVALAAAGLAACGPAALNKTLETSDSRFTFSVPDGWDYYDGPEEEGLVLQLTDSDGAFGKVYFYDNAVYDYPYDVCLEDITGYYEGSIIGEIEKGQAGGMDASRFEYNMVDLNENGEEADYHGYEYVVDTPYGVMDVDLFYAQDKVMGKIFKPSSAQLELLCRIAQSLEVTE